MGYLQTHRRLVHLTRQMARTCVRFGCKTIISESHMAESERPDVLGWDVDGYSYLFECKSGKGGLRDDENKSRECQHLMGMGDFRYYVTPSGLYSPERIPETWGLIEISDSDEWNIVIERPIRVCDKQAEIQILQSMLMKSMAGKMTEFGFRYHDFSPETMDQEWAKQNQDTGT